MSNVVATKSARKDKKNNNKKNIHKINIIQVIIAKKQKYIMKRIQKNFNNIQAILQKNIKMMKKRKKYG